jgi:hypothetical protein
VAALQGAAAVGGKGAPAGPLQALLAEAQAALRKVGRIGFRRADRGDAAMVAALGAGAAAAVEVLRELDRLLPVLAQAGPADALLADRRAFEAAFQRIYASGNAP